jgi:hypothetical protein
VRTLTALVIGLAVVNAAAQQTPVNPDTAIVNAFLDRVSAYVTLHHKIDATLQELPKGATLDQIEEHQRALEQMIGRARSGAKQGDFFTADVRAYFRRQITRALTGPEGRAIRDTIMDENPRNIRLTVNARYPDSVPLSTTPAPVLLLLPKLPEELTYRFMGDRLVLLDEHAGTVVDYIEGALGR